MLNLGNRRGEVFTVNRLRVIVGDGIIGLRMREKDRVSEHHRWERALFKPPNDPTRGLRATNEKGLPIPKEAG
jgi:hypothetical protein